MMPGSCTAIVRSATARSMGAAVQLPLQCRIALGCALSRRRATAPACSSSIHRASNVVDLSEETGDESPYYQPPFFVSGSAAATCATAPRRAVSGTMVPTWCPFALHRPRGTVGRGCPEADRSHVRAVRPDSLSHRLLCRLRPWAKVCVCPMRGEVVCDGGSVHGQAPAFE